VFDPTGGCRILRTAADVLKSRTCEVHRRVEAGLNLLDADLRLERLMSVVRRLDAFWAGTVPAVDACLSATPELAERLDWQRRRRGEQAAFGTAASIAPAVFASITTADVLGWLYVREGSTLGGAVIESHVSGLAGKALLSSFAPYAEGPQPMWRSYLSALEEWTAGDDLRVELVAQAALSTFSSLEEWLSSVFVASTGFTRAV
jgi:heme oxygenase